MNSNVVFQLRTLLQNAQSVLIALPESADDDTLAAGLALQMTLSKMQKQVTIASSGDIKVGQAYLYGVDRITKRVSGGTSLVISFPYQEGTIEKVTYNIEGEMFNLVIEPRDNKLNFNQNQVQYTYGKSEYDAVFVLGVGEMKQLGELYSSGKAVFSGKNIINIDKHQANSKFGSINIVENAPLCQSVALILRALRMPIETDPASNLYTGIMSTSDGLSFDNANPDTLEAVAFLLRAKAKLIKKNSLQNQKVTTQETNGFSEDAVELPANEPAQEQKGQSVSDDENAPDDWLKPKIFTTHNN